MADQRPGSYARQIDPDGGIKGPDLSAAFDKAQQPEKAAEPQGPAIASQQVANTRLAPREPAPSHAYNRAKAAQHIGEMRADDRAVKEATIKARAQTFTRQNAAQKSRGAPSLGKSIGKSFGRDREHGDD